MIWALTRGGAVFASSLTAMMTRRQRTSPIAGGVERNSTTITAVPTLTAEQRQQALRQVIAARAVRKQLLDAIAPGQRGRVAVE